MSTTLSEEQKSSFKVEFKNRYYQYLKQFSEDNPSLFDESAQEIIDNLNSDND